MQDGETIVTKAREALEPLKDPESGRSVVAMDQVHAADFKDGLLVVRLGLTTHSAAIWDDVREAAQALLQKALPDVAKIEVAIETHDRAAEKVGEIGLSAKSVIMVGSGKGGVGKSTIAAALAYGLKRAGSVVGLVDADVYGPSIPHLLGLDGRPEVVDNRIQPIEQDGLKVMSMGFLIPPGEAVVWRGPMLHGAITQFLRDTAWGELDYLIIDMPPGTGDIALTLSQLLPLTGAVVVCTPQQVALLDAVKAIAMFRKVNIPILGMVENMSGFICPDCGKQYDIFGSGGAEDSAKELQVPFLGGVPINMGIRTRGDSGSMADVFSDDAIRPSLEQISVELVRGLANQVRRDPPLPSLSVL